MQSLKIILESFAPSRERVTSVIVILSLLGGLDQVLIQIFTVLSIKSLSSTKIRLLMISVLSFDFCRSPPVT